jgi:hypothetical protein
LLLLPPEQLFRVHWFAALPYVTVLPLMQHAQEIADLQSLLPLAAPCRCK